MMASFSAFGGDFPSIALIVLHSLEGSVLWSSVSTNCLHVFLRCSFVVLVISSFICRRAGDVGPLNRSQFAFFKLKLVRWGMGLIVRSICKLMRIGRWSEPRFVIVYQLLELIREADANETSGEDGLALLGIYLSSLSTTPSGVH